MYTNKMHPENPKKILHVFSTFAIGGPQVRFTQIANGLDDSFEHIVIALDGRYDAEEKLDPDSNVKLVKVENLKKLSLLKRLKAIKNILARYQIDSLMTYNFGAIEWVFVNRFTTRFNTVHWEDGFGPGEKTKPLPRRNMFRRIAFSKQSKVVVPSHTLMTIAKQYWKCNDEQLVYFPNGIALPNEARLNERKKTDENVVCGTLATLRAEKNIHRLIDTYIANGVKGQLLIGGDGPMLDELKKYVTSKGLEDKVIFKGRIRDIWGFLSLLDIFCISSDTEQMPISILEAMAYALPVVSTDVGDIKKMLSDQNEEYVVHKDQFAKAYLKINQDPKIWSKIGNANQAKVQKHYSLETMISNFKNLI